jgi:AraC-like DNA-binding protein
MSDHSVTLRPDWTHAVASHVQVLSGILSDVPIDVRRLRELLATLPVPSSQAEQIFMNALLTLAALRALKAGGSSGPIDTTALERLLGSPVGSNQARTFEECCGASLEGGARPDGLAARARRYLSVNFAGRPTLRAVARSLHSTPSVVRRHFVTAYGETPHQYLTRLRVTKAVELLKQNALKTDAIAAAVGYRCRKDLVRSVRCFTGLTPRHHRTA